VPFHYAHLCFCTKFPSRMPTVPDPFILPHPSILAVVQPRFPQNMVSYIPSYMSSPNPGWPSSSVVTFSPLMHFSYSTAQSKSWISVDAPPSSCSFPVSFLSTPALPSLDRASQEANVVPTQKKPLCSLPSKPHYPPILCPTA
jgi:hypothetical protein